MQEIDSGHASPTTTPAAATVEKGCPATPIERPAHLAPEAVEALGLGRDERIAFARMNRWIPYPEASEALRFATDLMMQPRATEATRPTAEASTRPSPRKRRRGMLIVGRPGNGKSTILRRIATRNPPVVRTGGSTTAAVIEVELSPGANESTFWSDILDACGSVHRVTDHWAVKRASALSVLGTLRPRLLALDEFHNIQTGTAAAQRHMLTVIKWLSNTLDLPLVLAGTEDAVNLMRNDAQLTSRFQILALEWWKTNPHLPELLDSFEAMLPLPERSFLSDEEMMPRILELCDGTIGSLAWVLQEAAADAIRRDRNRIDLELLSRAAPDTEEERERQLKLV